LRLGGRAARLQADIGAWCVRTFAKIAALAKE
jgi:hypothetical protein